MLSKSNYKTRISKGSGKPTHKRAFLSARKHGKLDVYSVSQALRGEFDSV